MYHNIPMNGLAHMGLPPNLGIFNDDEDDYYHIGPTSIKSKYINMVI